MTNRDDDHVSRAEAVAGCALWCLAVALALLGLGGIVWLVIHI